MSETPRGPGFLSEPAAELYDDAKADNDLIDRLIAGEFDNLLSRAGVTTNPATAHPDDVLVDLVLVLAAWRKDTTSEPIPELVDTGTANEAIRAAVGERRQESPVLGPLGAVLAAAAVSTVIWVLVSLLWLVVTR